MVTCHTRRSKRWVKEIIYQYSLMVSIVIVFCGAVFVALGYNQIHEWPPIIALAVAFMSLIFLIQKQELEEAKLTNDLFKSFNERFDKLNRELNALMRKQEEPNALMGKQKRRDEVSEASKGSFPASDPDVGFSDDELKTLYDYFNLCAEEFLMYEQGYVYCGVWEGWRNGMAYYFSNDQILELWENDKFPRSYYGFNPRTHCPLRKADI